MREIININYGMEKCLGDSRMYITRLIRFARVSNDFNEACIANTTRDNQQLFLIIKNIRFKADELCFERLYDACNDIVMALSKNDFTDFSDKFDIFSECFIEVVSLIQTKYMKNPENASFE